MSKLLELLELLPSATKKLPKASLHPALSRPQHNVRFVEPALDAVLSPGAHVPSVVLISAPGAVGKTTLARQIAALKRGWLWDLSRLVLGDNTFVGTLAQSFGYGQLNQVLSSMQKGEVLFAIDAFDEAEIISGWDRIEQFVKEIWQFAVKSPRTTVVLLARSETAFLLRLLLEELSGTSPRFAMYEIQFFDEPASKTFVSNELGARGIDVHLQHPLPFQQALDELFNVIAAGLGVTADRKWLEASSRSFIGYAPVLQTVASYLAQWQNFKEALSNIAGRSGQSEGGRLLAELMNSLLDREQKKLTDALREKHPQESVSWDGWDTLYDPRQQMKRVFLYSRSDSLSTAIESPNIPAWLHKDYSDSIGAFLQNHPFLRDRSFSGPAFRDYAYAFLLRRNTVSSAVEAHLDSGEFVPTPLLAHFYVKLSSEPALGTHAGYLYESAASQHGLAEFTQTTLIAPADENHLHRLEIITSSPYTELETSSISIDMSVDLQHPITFRNSLRHALLEVEGGVILGSPSREFELEDVTLSCQTLQIQAKEIVARCFTPHSQIALSANSYIPPVSTLLVAKRGLSHFSISWPNGNVHPWAPYYQVRPPDESLDVAGALNALARVLTWFRRDHHSEFARYVKLIDNVVVGDSPVRQSILNRLLATQILTQRGHLYVLDPDRAKHNGINWTDLRARRVTPELRRFLQDFLRSAATAT